MKHEKIQFVDFVSNTTRLIQSADADKFIACQMTRRDGWTLETRVKNS